MRPSLSAIAKTVGAIISPEHVFALADQAVVSGTSFLTTLLIARWSSSSQLGVYAVGISLLLSVQTFQESLILEPFIIQRHYQDGTPAERAGASLLLSFLFAGASIVILTAVATSFLSWAGGSEMIAMTFAVAAVLPFALAREFARRFSFAHHLFRHAFFLDLAVALIQLLTLSWLGVSGRMSALSAAAALGSACAVTAGAWLYRTRAEFAVRVKHLGTVLKQTWTLGKWLLAGRITLQVQGYVTYWISIIIAGAAVTGIYTACFSIVAFANPLLIGLNNSFFPRAVSAWKSGGGPALWREAIRNTVLIAVLMTAFTLAVLLAGEHVMRFLYHGAEYEGHGQMLTVLALALFAGAVAAPPSFALATMERPRPIVTTGVFGAGITVALIWVLMMRWGLLGAAYGLLGGSAAGSVARWIAFYLVVTANRSYRTPSSLARVVSVRDV